MGSRVSVPRSVLTEAAQCLARQGGPWADTMAGKLLKLAEPVRKRSKPSRLASKKTKAARKEKKNSETAAIREAVFRRATIHGKWTEPVCELCFVRRATDMHHVFGRVRVEQSARNCLAVCRWCHDEVGRLWAAVAMRLECLGYFAEAAEARKKQELAESKAPTTAQAESLVTTGRYPQEPLKLPGGESR